MKVRVAKNCVVDLAPRAVGDVIDISDAEAVALIGSGQVVPADQVSRETKAGSDAKPKAKAKAKAKRKS